MYKILIFLVLTAYTLFISKLSNDYYYSDKVLNHTTQTKCVIVAKSTFVLNNKKLVQYNEINTGVEKIVKADILHVIEVIYAGHGLQNVYRDAYKTECELLSVVKLLQNTTYCYYNVLLNELQINRDIIDAHYKSEKNGAIFLIIFTTVLIIVFYLIFNHD